jgi:trans-aconitate methyltransferase
VADGAMTDTSGTTWDSTLYDESFGIIARLGVDVVALLAPQPGERIVDLGCGTGGLTAQIAAAGAEVVGIDSSEAMIARAMAPLRGRQGSELRG